MTGEHCVDFLVRFYGKKLSEDARRYYVGCLSALSEELRTNATRAAAEKSAHFPTLKQLRDVVAEIKDARWALKKHEPIAPPWANDPPNDEEHASVSWALIKRIQREKMPVSQRIVEFRKMHERWPLFGWDEAASKEQDYMAERQAKGMPC